MNDLTGLDRPSAIATTSNVPFVPAGIDPAHAGLLAFRFQVTVTNCGTPCAKSTVVAAAAGALQAAESQITCPVRVTTTCTSDAP